MQPDEKFWKKCEGEQIANAYEFEQLLGCGAFGGVFRAIQIANGRRLNKRVAVKLMLSGTIQQEELNFALDLPSHQNLVQHHAGNNVEIRGFPMFYLVMELADCSLADFVKKRGGRISSVVAKAIVRDIAQGLKYLHELDAGNSQDKRYVHRDLKLLNVLQVGGVWKIADFGLSKALDRGTMQASKIAGTPYYMPPELFRNGYVSTKWDVWSLGVMIVEMLTGHFPFEAVYQDELERKIQRENPNLQGVSSEWLDIVKGCLVKDHEQRLTAIDVLKALESIGASIPKNQSPTIPKSHPSQQKTQLAHTPKSIRNRFWGMAIIIGLISAVGFIIWQNMKSARQSPIISSPVPNKTATELISIDKDVAMKLVIAWNSIKNRALGSAYEEDTLTSILTEPTLSDWQSRVKELKSNNSYLQYINHSIEIIKVVPDSDDKAKVIAKISETRNYYNNGMLDASASKAVSTFTVEYDFVRKDSTWLIREMLVF